MTAAVLDTLRCAQTLKDAGFAPKQAEATAQVLGDALADVATKEDLDRHTAMQKADLDRHTAMQKANLDRHAAMQKADLDRLEAKLDDAVTGLNTKIDNATSAGKSNLEAAFDRLETKIDAVIQRVHSMEASMQKQFASIQEQLGSFRDQFRHQARVTYILLGIIAGLAFGDLVAPYLPSGKTPTAPPAAAESPTAVPDVHSIPARTGTEAGPLANPAETPPPSSTS